VERDKEIYKTWVKEKIQHKPDRSHGFRFRGQYEEQIKTMVSAGVGGPGGEEITETVITDMGEASAGG